jgi:hypothetical protein
MEKNIGNHMFRDFGLIKNPADGDGIVGRVKMTKNPAAFPPTPTHGDLSHAAIETLAVQLLKEDSQVVTAAPWVKLPLPTAVTPHLECFLLHLWGINKGVVGKSHARMDSTSI